MAKTAKEQKQTKLRQQLLEEMLKLSTSGFGLVAALAWNELIKEVINQYIKPIVGEGSGIISLGVYAIIVTILAVTVTYQLSKIKERI